MAGHFVSRNYMFTKGWISVKKIYISKLQITNVLMFQSSACRLIMLYLLDDQRLLDYPYFMNINLSLVMVLNFFVPHLFSILSTHLFESKLLLSS